MKRSERLRVLTRLTDSAERLARIQLAKANQDVQRKKEQQRQLVSYASEYQQSLVRAGEAGLTGAQLSRYQLFIGSLDKTIETQQLAVQRSQQQAGQSTAIWQAQRNRQRVFDDLVERARGDEQIDENRREQRAMDELGTQRHQRIQRSQSEDEL